MSFTVDPQLVRDVLEEWASESEQRRRWLSDRAAGSEVSSFAEACEGLFTDRDLGCELDNRSKVSIRRLINYSGHSMRRYPRLTDVGHPARMWDPCD